MKRYFFVATAVIAGELAVVVLVIGTGRGVGIGTGVSTVAEAVVMEIMVVEEAALPKTSVAVTAREWRPRSAIEGVQVKSPAELILLVATVLVPLKESRTLYTGLASVGALATKETDEPTPAPEPGFKDWIDTIGLMIVTFTVVCAVCPYISETLIERVWAPRSSFVGVQENVPEELIALLFNVLTAYESYTL